ncbi:MAG: hypothetical protein ACRERU_10645 [Methylococcales bacterium]
MAIKRVARSGRPLRLLAGCAVSILIYGCTVPERAYRNAYGPGLLDGDAGLNDTDRPILDRGIAAPESREGTQGNRKTRVPIENPGRPEPPPSKIPGISDIPEIPDEPTVLPE